MKTLYQSLIVIGLISATVIGMGQGGTGKVDSNSAKPAGTNSSPTKRPGATRPPPVMNLLGTAWRVEGREGTKVVGTTVFEFAESDRVYSNGDRRQSAHWKQAGRRVVITFEDGKVKSVMDGVITANQIVGTIIASDAQGEHHGTWRAT